MLLYCWKHFSARAFGTSMPLSSIPFSSLACCQVTVQAGCRVQHVADYLRPRGLSLQNYASIREQQVGGFTQVRCREQGSFVAGKAGRRAERIPAGRLLVADQPTYGCAPVLCHGFRIFVCVLRRSVPSASQCMCSGSTRT